MLVSISGTARPATRSSNRWLATAACFALMGALPAHPSSQVPVASNQAIPHLGQAKRQSRPFIRLFVEETMQGNEDNGNEPAIGESPKRAEQESLWCQPFKAGQ